MDMRNVNESSSCQQPDIQSHRLKTSVDIDIDRKRQNTTTQVVFLMHSLA